MYSSNKITKTRIQIYCQNWNGLFSNISHQMMIWLSPTVSKSKSKRYKPQKNEEIICFKFTTTALSNFDKQWSNAHFVSFLFYYNCNTKKCLLNVSTKYYIQLFAYVRKMLSSRKLATLCMFPKILCTYLCTYNLDDYNCPFFKCYSLRDLIIMELSLNQHRMIIKGPLDDHQVIIGWPSNEH